MALHWCLWGHGAPRGDKGAVLGPPCRPVGPGSPSCPMMAKVPPDGPFHALAAISEAAPPSSDTRAGCLLLAGPQGAAGHVPFPVAVPTISQPLGGCGAAGAKPELGMGEQERGARHAECFVVQRTAKCKNAKRFYFFIFFLIIILIIF